ncbi:autoantigen p27 domain-containing protein [Aerococcaceae bacterium NML190073]|nr:autoantigen p27 domain-containing protein [Aerococcaceae bacterium NML190073]
MGNQLLKGICPKCGLPYEGRPALSRDDNKSLICPDCGVREALESIGVDKEEQNRILETIHRSVEN